MRRSAAARRQFCEERADFMATHATPAELALWEMLGPLGFRCQVAVDGETKNGGLWNYILDLFYCRSDGTGLCIEVDGSAHRKREGHDRRRDTRLETIKITTMRFSNRRVLKEPGAVLAEIQEAIGE